MEIYRCTIVYYQYYYYRRSIKSFLRTFLETILRGINRKENLRNCSCKEYPYQHIFCYVLLWQVQRKVACSNRHPVIRKYEWITFAGSIFQTRIPVVNEKIRTLYSSYNPRKSTSLLSEINREILRGRGSKGWGNNEKLPRIKISLRNYHWRGKKREKGVLFLKDRDYFLCSLNIPRFHIDIISIFLRMSIQLDVKFLSMRCEYTSTKCWANIAWNSRGI